MATAACDVTAVTSSLRTAARPVAREREGSSAIVAVTFLEVSECHPSRTGETRHTIVICYPLLGNDSVSTLPR
jgi:hypothetical protein